MCRQIKEVIFAYLGRTVLKLSSVITVGPDEGAEKLVEFTVGRVVARRPAPSG